MRLKFDVKKTWRDLVTVARAPRIVRRYDLRYGRLPSPVAGIVLTNPSIVPDSHGFVVAARQVSYRLVGRGARFQLLPGLTKRESHTWISRMSQAGAWSPEMATFGTSDAVTAEEYEMGLEDPRLFRWNGELWGLWVLATRQPDGRRATRMAIGQVDAATVSNLTPLGSFKGRREEKNWIPFTVDDELRFIQELSTMSIYAWADGELRVVSERESEIPELIGHSGSSQLVRWRDGWVCITHTRINLPGFLLPLQRRYYIHRFVYLNDSYDLVAVSSPFVFERKRVEFCAGLAYSNDEFRVGYGLQDRDASWAVIPENVVENLLSISGERSSDSRRGCPS